MGHLTSVIGRRIVPRLLAFLLGATIAFAHAQAGDPPGFEFTASFGQYGQYGENGWFASCKQACDATAALFAPGYSGAPVACNHVVHDPGVTWTYYEYFNRSTGTWGGLGFGRCYARPAPYRIEIAAPAIAMPGTAPLDVVITVLQGSPRPGVAVTLTPEGAAGGTFSPLAASTDASGVVRVRYTPPARLVGGVKVEKLAATCSGCSNRRSVSITVLGTPAQPQQEAAMCPAGLFSGKPIALATGTKLLREVDWLDRSPHPLSLHRFYASAWGATPAAGLGAHWNHGHSHRIEGGAGDSIRTVLLGDGSASRFINTAAAGAPAQWQAVGHQDTLAESAAGILFARTQADSLWTFDPQSGQAISVRERNGWTYRYSYAAGRLVRVSNAFGRALQFTYDAHGRLQAVTFPDGTAVSYAFDAASRLAQATDQTGAVRSYLYEDPRFAGALTGTLDEAGQRHNNVLYDTEGRAILSELAGGIERTSVQYGNSSSTVTDALGTTRTYEYQTMTGQAEGARTRVASAPAADGRTGASWTYDADSLPASETDFLGVATLFTWDAARRLPLSATRAAGRPEAQATTTEWHPTLRLPALLAEPGRTTALTYDGSGNALAAAVTDTSTGQVRNWSWTYGPQGLPATMTDPSGGVWQYGHDADGNRISERDPAGRTTRFTHDGAGRVLTRTEPGGLVTAYGWDARGRLLVEDRGGEKTTYAYTASGQVGQVVLPSGYAVSYRYDAAQRLIGVRDNRGASVDLTLDGAGNRVREEVRGGAGS